MSSRYYVGYSNRMPGGGCGCLLFAFVVVIWLVSGGC